MAPSEHTELDAPSRPTDTDGAASCGAAGEDAAEADSGFDVSSLLDREAMSGRAEDAMQFFEVCHVGRGGGAAPHAAAGDGAVCLTAHRRPRRRTT